MKDVVCDKIICRKSESLKAAASPVSCNYPVEAKKYPMRSLIEILKYRKNLVSIRIDTLVSCNITSQEISDKLKKFFKRNVSNILETLTRNF